MSQRDELCGKRVVPGIQIGRPRGVLAAVYRP
jgi:hypothetical protein